jgi:hypothetical protein
LEVLRDEVKVAEGGSGGQGNNFMD